MKRLLIMRHAKSSWDAGVDSDHARPLNDRGRRDAPAIAQELTNRNLVPDRIVSSDAKRTEETAILLQSVWGDVPIEYHSKLYHAGVTEIRNALESASNDTETILVLGHNPGWQHAILVLAETSIDMTTANVAVLEIESNSWAVALQQNWTFVDVIRPREL